MSPIRLGEVFRTLSVPAQLAPEPLEEEIGEVVPDRDLRLLEAIQGLSRPTVYVEPPDLDRLAELIRGPTAEDLKALFEARIHGEGQQFAYAPEIIATLAGVQKALESLDFRMMGIGRSYGGAGKAQVDLTGLGIATEATLASRASEATLALLEKNSRVAEWAEIASATNATATATRTAVAGQSHYITSITGSYDLVPTTAIRLDLREAGVNKYSVFVGEHTDIELPRPFRMTANTAATLVLGAGGLGATGLVTLQGYTS